MSNAKFQFDSSALEDTDRLGVAIGDALSPGIVLGLDGTLGAGKTRLTQAIGTGLGIGPNQIVSPTFTIMVPHSGRLDLAHLDAYRIGSPEEVDELGLDEMIVDGVVLIVEWAERIARLLPPLDIRIAIEHVGDQERRFELRAESPAGEQLIEQLRQRLAATEVADR
jgi:tRNA threonylcarbamoyladenosine biosynthesis protein TsaE